MAKNITMTRERKIALPIILAAAKGRLNMDGDLTGKERQELAKALEAFNG